LQNSPAEESGIKVGDEIVMLDTATDSTALLSSYLSPESIQEFVKRHGEEEINFSLVRGDELKQLKVTPKINESGSPVVGISMDMVGTLKLPFFKAIGHGLKLSWDVLIGTIEAFYNLIRNAFVGQANLASLTGPVGIVKIVGDATHFGFAYLLSLTALISINLVVINLFPFPALDGGRLLFLLIEKIKGSRIKPIVANLVNTIGFGILMILMLVITYHDIVKLF